MNRIPWQVGWYPFAGFQREVGRIFENFEVLQAWPVPRGVPALNLYDDGDRYFLVVPLPGLGAEEVDVSITGETLIVRGDRRRAEGVEEESYRRQERSFGRWTRTVTMPDRVEVSEVSASFSHGVLTVILPKADEAKPRQISVTPSSVT